MFPSSLQRWAPAPGALLLALVLAALTPALVAAQEQPAQLDIKPVPASASGYFELTLDPGTTHELTVEIGNYGTAPAEAHTYAADVYSLINGGMGVRLAGETISGATTWLNYPTERFTLEGRQAVHRTFTLTIPRDASPGEYLTSIVVEGNPALASSSDGAVINQVIRKAVAIVITIAGTRRSDLEIGAASHLLVADNSVVRIELLNTGNVRIAPTGVFVLRDSAGVEMSQYDVDIDALFAGTTTSLEIPFAGQLPPGHYTIDLTLADAAAELSAVTASIPLEVVAPAFAPSATPEAPQAAPINLPAPAPGEQPAPPGQIIPTINSSLLNLIRPLLIFALLLAALVLLALRGRR